MAFSDILTVGSLGCKAVFLLGGPTRDEPPLAMFVRSRDVVLMAGSARHCFHGTSIENRNEMSSHLYQKARVLSVGVQFGTWLLFNEHLGSNRY